MVVEALRSYHYHPDHRATLKVRKGPRMPNHRRETEVVEAITTKRAQVSKTKAWRSRPPCHLSQAVRTALYLLSAWEQTTLLSSRP
jgi:hypothetical protein